MSQAVCPRCGHGVTRFPCWQCGYPNAGGWVAWWQGDGAERFTRRMIAGIAALLLLMAGVQLARFGL